MQTASLPLALILALAAPAAHAAVFCVGTTGQFQTALGSALANQESDEIRLRSGTYVAPYPDGFVYIVPTNVFAYGLTITGGWTTNCTRSGRDASQTVLSGFGTKPVLRILTNGGAIKVRNLTIADASISGPWGALHVATQGGFGPSVEIERVILRDNASWTALEIYTKGAILVTGCLFHSNLVTVATGSAARIVALGPNDPRITNNTIADNHALDASPAGLTLDNSASADPQANVTNNIFWGNDNYDVYVVGHAEPFDSNDFGVGFGSYTGPNNTQVDPEFRDPATFDYRPVFDSPMVDSGSNTAASLPNLDLLGVARPQNGTYDRGAYEYPPPLFADGFESGDTSAWSSTVP